MADSDTDFAKNLALLCSYAPSIAEVCRRMDINRAQFNRYLAGTATPSRRSMRRICDHFGVQEAELRLPHARFAEIVALKPAAPTQLGGASPLPGYPPQVYANAQPLPDRYYGYYHRYFYSGAGDNAVTKSLVHIFHDNGRAVWKNVELASRPASSKGPRNTLKYVGEVVLLTDRIHVVEYEMLGAHNFCYTILYPAYGNHLTWLNGLQTWLALSPGRHPTTATVALKFLGRRVDVRKALASCGTAPDDDPALEREALDRLYAVHQKQSAALAVDEAWG
jgi:transcriptional regulator with XRE-family HTH domain